MAAEDKVETSTETDAPSNMEVDSETIVEPEKDENSVDKTENAESRVIS